MLIGKGKGKGKTRAGRERERKHENTDRRIDAPPGLHSKKKKTEQMGDTRVGARAAALLREVVACEPENLPPYNVRRRRRRRLHAFLRGARALLAARPLSILPACLDTSTSNPLSLAFL